MQTILGSGGAIGSELAKALRAYTSDIRLVSRNPRKENEGDQLFPADLTSRDAVFTAVEGSKVVYLTVGFEYKTKVWEAKWPPLIRNVVDACIAHKARLVFFDNIYALGPDQLNPITENSKVNPSSRKGKVRAEVERVILEAIEKKQLEAIIARSPDFFSDNKGQSALMNLVFDNLAKNKKAQWFCNAKVKHSMGYCPELAKGTAMLGNAEGVWNQIWNLPCDPTPITGEQWVKLFADGMGKTNAYKTLPAWMVKTIGIFVPILGELGEMLYQFDRDYQFDSSKFNRHFNYSPITHAEAVNETLERLGAKK